MPGADAPHAKIATCCVDNSTRRLIYSVPAPRRAYYFHRFYDFQPDLDTGNPALQEELRKVMGFWLELGVDGFRVDALPFRPGWGCFAQQCGDVAGRKA